MIAFNLLSFYLFYLGINPKLFGKTGDLCIFNMFFLFLSHLSLGTIQVLRHQRADAHFASKNTLLKRNTLHCYIFTVNNYMQFTGMVTGENFAFFIYRHFVEIL